jgi:hypothetical protein
VGPPSHNDWGIAVPRYRNGHTRKTTKKYPRITAGPLRGQYIHRVVAAAMLGRKLRKDEQVDHRDHNKLNFAFDNLIVRGESDHGWVSAKQAWFMKQKDGKLKQEWDEFMASRDEEQQVAVMAVKAGRA